MQLTTYKHNPHTRNANNFMNQEIKNAYGTESLRRGDDSPGASTRRASNAQTKGFLNIRSQSDLNSYNVFGVKLSSRRSVNTGREMESVTKSYELVSKPIVYSVKESIENL